MVSGFASNCLVDQKSPQPIQRNCLKCLQALNLFSPVVNRAADGERTWHKDVMWWRHLYSACVKNQTCPLAESSEHFFTTLTVWAVSLLLFCARSWQKSNFSTRLLWLCRFVLQDVLLLLPTLLQTNIDSLSSQLAQCNVNLNSTCCSLTFFCSYAVNVLFEIHYFWYFCCELHKWKPDNASTGEWCHSLITNTQSLVRNISILSANHGSSHNLSRLGRNVICQLIDLMIYYYSYQIGSFCLT